VAVPIDSSRWSTPAVDHATAANAVAIWPRRRSVDDSTGAAAIAEVKQVTALRHGTRGGCSGGGFQLRSSSWILDAMLRTRLTVGVIGLATAAGMLGFAWWLWEQRDTSGVQQHAFLGLMAFFTAGIVVTATSNVLHRLRDEREIPLDGWRHPIDAIGLWYKDLPFPVRLVVVFISFPGAVVCWFLWQLRRGWVGPPAA
jgi:hypothetical protein